jgi:hypothetical protein
MPLKKGTSAKTVSKNIKEFKKGPRNKATARKSGKEAARKQAIAVALKEKRKSAKNAQGRNIATATKPKRKPQNRKSRNKGRQ